MKIEQLFIAFLLCVCFISACKKETEIKGEAFIVSDDKVTKLAAIPIKIIKKEKAGKLFGDPTPLTDVDFSTTTDSDGKFSLIVPKGDYVLAADFYRIETQIFHYHYYWRVAFKSDGGEKKIVLDPTNLQSDFTIAELP